MKILKTMNEPGAEPYEISKEDAIEYLENRGYWNEGIVDEILQTGQSVNLRTLWAFYKFIA